MFKDIMKVISPIIKDRIAKNNIIIIIIFISFDNSLKDLELIGTNWN
jgi:hypothetical protein